MIARAKESIARGTRPERPEVDALGEAVRDLLRRLSLRGTDACRPLRTLGLTGCAGGEGVSTVAARLAAEAAVTRREPVLLVDANLTHPTAHQLLEVQPGPGLAEVLGGTAELPDVVQPSPVARLSVLAA